MPDEKKEVPREFEYDVALSFAGERRAYVAKVAAALKKKGVRVFYDADEQVRAWGKYLEDFLGDAYVDKARMVVVFLSKEYVRKPWTLYELKSVVPRLFREDRSYVLPALVDDVKIPSSLKGLHHVRIGTTSAEELAKKIVQKLKLEPDTPDKRLEERRIARLRWRIAAIAAWVLATGGLLWVIWGIATHYDSHTSVERGAVTPRFIQVHLTNSGLQASTMKEFRLVLDGTLPLPSPKPLSKVTDDLTKDRVPPRGSLQIRLKAKDDEILPKCVDGRYATLSERDFDRQVKVEVKVCESSGECKWISSEAFHAKEISVFLDEAIPEDPPPC